jgi:hypothetical protein
MDQTGGSERARKESHPRLMHCCPQIRQEEVRENVLIANASSTGHQRKEALMDPNMGTVMPLMLQHNVSNYRLMMLPEGPPSSGSNYSLASLELKCFCLLLCEWKINPSNTLSFHCLSWPDDAFLSSDELSSSITACFWPVFG